MDEQDEIYVFSGVVWFVRMENMPSETLGEVVGSLFTGRSKSTGRPLVPVFSTDDLATRFIALSGIRGIVPFKFTDPRQLLAVLEAMPPSGVNDLAIDMDADDAIYWPVTRLIECVKRFIG